MLMAKGSWLRILMTETEKTGLIRKSNGIYRESFSDIWSAEYSEDLDTGLWQVDIFKRATPEWHNVDYVSLEEARSAAQDYYHQV